MSVRRETLYSPGVPSVVSLVVRPPLPPGAAPHGVILFVHGFAIPPSNYTSLSKSIAEHGYVIVLPQVYAATDAVGEEPVIPLAQCVAHTFPGLPLILAGHSRGGQACMMAAIATLSSPGANFPMPTAVVLFDPVEGAPARCGLGGLRPYLLAEQDAWPCGLTNMPVLVLGAGLGSQPRWCPAAPPDHNYEAIWTALLDFTRRSGSRTRAGARLCCVVAKDMGHLDFLNEHGECEGLIVGISRFIVKNGALGRRTCHAFASVVVAEFLDAHVCGQSSRVYLDAWAHRVASLQSDRELYLAESNATVRARVFALGD